uniref:Uncharacterized protein n=1 Tax=Anguilla anguilla TaxID=7936 RepID=A0A0E9RXM5_ANGAN
MDKCFTASKKVITFLQVTPGMLYVKLGEDWINFVEEAKNMLLVKFKIVENQNVC